MINVKAPFKHRKVPTIIVAVSTGLAALLVLITFIAIVVWAWSGKRKQDFDEAANLPFDENTTERK